MRTCINDCKSGHKPDCETTETHKACELVEATRGFLCEKCFEQLRDALRDAPGIVFHLRSIYGILRSRSADGSQKVKREPPAPLNLSAFDLSESIFGIIMGKTISVKQTASGVAAEISQKCDELLSVFDVVVNQEEVEELSKVVKFVRSARKIYPLQEEIRVTAMPCPECDLLTVYTPPQKFMDGMQVSCSACGFVVPDDKVAFYAHLAEKGL